MSVHPRIAVHEVCFPASFTVPDILSWAESNGVRNIGLFSLRRNGDWTDAIRQVAASPIRVAYLSHASMFRLDDPASWADCTANLMATIDAARAMECPLVYGTTGPAGTLEFEEAESAFAAAIVPARDYAEKLGIRLLIETTSPAFCFTHFVHSLDDTVSVARKAGIGVCLDLWPTWHERGINQKIEALAADVAMIQVSDHVPRNMSPARDVIGTGIIRIEQLLAAALRGGYRGIVDLELFGRPEETAVSDTLASVHALSDILDRIGF